MSQQIGQLGGVLQLCRLCQYVCLWFDLVIQAQINGDESDEGRNEERWASGLTFWSRSSQVSVYSVAFGASLWSEMKFSEVLIWPPHRHVTGNHSLEQITNAWHISVNDSVRLSAVSGTFIVLVLCLSPKTSQQNVHYPFLLDFFCKCVPTWPCYCRTETTKNIILQHHTAEIFKNATLGM